MTRTQPPSAHLGAGTAPWVLMAVVTVIGAQSLLLAPLLPDIAAALRTGPASIGVASGAYGLATAVSAFAAGRVVDPFPRRAVLRVAAAVMAVGLLTCAAAPNVTALVAGQALLGLAAGVAVPVCYAFAGDVAPTGAETRALGRVLLGWSAAMVVGVPAAAALADVIGWRRLFVVLAGLAGALVALLGLLPGGVRGGATTSTYRDAIVRPGIRALLVVVLAFMAAFYATYVYLGTEVRVQHGAGAAGAGLVALAYGLGFGVATLLDGLVDRVGPRALLAPVLIALAGYYGLVPSAVPDLPVLLALCVGWGVVSHVGLGVLVALLTRHAGPARGPVMALYSTATYLATALATAGLGVVYQWHGLSAVTAVAATAVLLALLPAHRVRRRPGARRSPGFGGGHPDEP